MIFEKILFNLLAIALFTIMFMKLIKKNDTNYVSILTVQFIGIGINFIELFLSLQFSIIIKIVEYCLAVVIPCMLLFLEYKKSIDLSELFMLAKVQKYLKMNQNEEAKRCLFAFFEKHPNTYIGHKLLAEIYEKEENYENAASEYRRVTEINKKDLNAVFKLASNLEKANEAEEAITILQNFLKVQPENEKASDLLGTILFDQERYKEAISVYMFALRYHPESYELYYSLGMTCTMINDFQRAKEFYEKAANINSMLYNAHLNLGQIALIYGDLEEAEKYFIASSKGKNVEAGSYYYLSKIAMLKGEEERAKNYMNVAIELDGKTYKQAQKDPIFTPIKEKINKPNEQNSNENGNEKQIKKLTQKEIKTNKHLMKTGLLIENLSNEDIAMIKNKKKSQTQIENQIKEKGQL